MPTSWMECAAVGFENVLMLKHENRVFFGLGISALYMLVI